MTTNNIKFCKYPKCKKEVHSEKAFFCGEHRRKMNDVKDKTRYMVVLVALWGIKEVGKIFLDDKNKKH